MAYAPSYLKYTLLPLTLASASVISTQAAAESTGTYQEPTRGFFLEHGMVAKNGKASVELHTGSDGFNNGGGIRLGLSDAELLLNTGLSETDQNSAFVKWKLPSQNSDGSKSTPFVWSALLGLGHTNIENDDGSHNENTNFTFGVAASVKADAGLFSISPKIVYSNADQQDDDTFLELDLGAYVGIIETQSGLFSVGAEAMITTEDDTDNTIALGARWLYNDRINLDFVPVVFSDNNFSGVPGLVRLNIAF